MGSPHLQKLQLLRLLNVPGWGEGVLSAVAGHGWVCQAVAGPQWGGYGCCID